MIKQKFITGKWRNGSVVGRELISIDSKELFNAKLCATDKNQEKKKSGTK